MSLVRQITPLKMCACELALTYGEVDLAAAHHIVQEGVLSDQLHTNRESNMFRYMHLY